jgi:starch synthase
MYSQRYGTLPLVHATGGLADTVSDGVSGFSFNDLSCEALISSINRAAALYFTQRRRFTTIQRNAMRLNNAWSNKAAEYISLYTRLSGRDAQHSRSVQEYRQEVPA